MTQATRDSDQPMNYYVSLESMEGFDTRPKSGAGPKTRLRRGRDILTSVYPGILVAGTIALAATWLSQAYHAPVMLFALLLGIAFHFLHEEGRCRAGIEFGSRTVLRLGVALLGLRITLEQVASLGVHPILTVVAGVATTSLAGYWLGRMLGLGRMFGLLSGGAVAICGASAALAISTTLPAYPQKERDTVLTVVGVTTLSTIAMVLYPLLVTALHLDHVKAGIFLGGTIHDVAQVVGAGYMISPETGDISTYVKLLRVAMLIPVTASIAFAVRQPGARGSKLTATFPLFLAGFAILVVLNSTVRVPQPAVDLALTASNWCLVTAIAALGMKTSLRDLLAVGWRPLGLMVAETLWLCGLVLGSIFLG
jgi:uncharacterized integral membrane protein (TIGR00698 family)